SRRSIPPCATSTASWHDGCIGSSSPSDATSDERITGWRTLCAGSPICSLTGAFCIAPAEQWDPNEARASRPVLRARGGETPPRDSPRDPVPEGQSRRGLATTARDHGKDK